MAKVSDLESKLSQANLSIQNSKTAEEKLRDQIVENSKNANISQSELETNLTEKIKSLDQLNETQRVQVQQLQLKLSELET